MDYSFLFYEKYQYKTEKIISLNKRNEEKIR